jgi:ribosomal protein S18 acetylase RimI-like enzyme
MNRAIEPASIALGIRPAELSDAGALAGLMCELGYETRVAEMEMRLDSILTDPRYKTFVAVNEGKICGMIGTVCDHSHVHNNVSGRILALVVSKTKRRRGVARQLVAVAENDFAERNITRITLTTRFEREGAHKLYESLGYNRNGFRFIKNLPAAAD